MQSCPRHQNFSIHRTQTHDTASDTAEISDVLGILCLFYIRQ